MPRPRQRVNLQDGLKLDLNQLARKGFIRRGANIGVQGIAWTTNYHGEIATGLITADLSGDAIGWFRIKIGNLDQQIMLVARSRHFGGKQWYFVCPMTNELASVLWKPPGATRFCSRHTWGRQVAYQSQFNDPTSRAHAGKARIRNRLSPGRDDRDFPPKPKGMRWKTYDRYAARFDRYERELMSGCAALLATLQGRLR